MRRIFYFLLTLLIAGCGSVFGGAKQTCDTYCLTQGGVCDRVEHGRSEFNTDTSQVKKRPTIFHCKFFN